MHPDQIMGRAGILILAALLATARPAAGTNGAIGTEDLVRIALTGNPELEARRAGAQAMAERPASLSSLPNPELRAGWMGEHLETARGPQSWVFSVEQELPLFGQRGLAAEVAGHEARVEAASVEAFELALAAEVRRKAAELRYLDLAIELRRADVEFLRGMRDAARIRYETGSGRLAALSEVELAIAAAERELLLLQGEQEAAVAEMNRLLGRPATDPLPPLADSLVVGVAADSLAALPALAERRPELRAASAGVEASSAARSLAGRANAPEFMLGFEYLMVDEGDSPSPEAGTDAWMVEVGVTLPIWRGAGNAQVKEADARRAQSAAALAAERSRIDAEIAAAISHVQRGGEVAALYASAIARAEEGLSAVEANYETARAELSEVLAARRALLEVRLADARARADLALAAADLARATGAPLPGGETP